MGGEYAFRIRGEKHAWSPKTITNLQKAVRINSKESFKEFSEKLMITINRCSQSEACLSLKSADQSIKKC